MQSTQTLWLAVVAIMLGILAFKFRDMQASEIAVFTVGIGVAAAMFLLRRSQTRARRNPPPPPPEA